MRARQANGICMAPSFVLYHVIRVAPFSVLHQASFLNDEGGRTSEEEMVTEIALLISHFCGI